MKIVFIHVKENFTPVPPSGLLYVGTMLKRDGHDVRIFDVNIKEREGIIKKIKEIDPDVIGFSAMTTSYSITRDFNKELKKEVPYAYYCWGGVHATAMPIETIKDNALDFLVYGEGELTMAEVCRKIKGKKSDFGRGACPEPGRGVNLQGINGVYYVENGEVKKNPARAFIEDLDSLLIPDRSLLANFKWYLSPPGILRGRFRYGITTMYASRGCPYQCIFCASKIIHGSAIRRRSVDNVLREMEYLKNNFGVTGIYFNDDTFAADARWLEEFCNKLKSGNLKMIWGCQTRANIAQSLDILEMMKKAGCCQVDIGCESGSDKVLENLKKGITSAMILKSFENLRALRMTTFATFILGNPGETMDDVARTREVAKMAPGGASFLILVPYPGSPLFKMALDNKWFLNQNNIVFDERWTNKQSDSPVMQASFKAEDLVKIRAKLQNEFFFRNNIPTILAFLKSPVFLYRALMTIAGHPLFIIDSIKKAVKKRKMTDFLEDIYQKFNEDLRQS
jgi:anaerobic magnesium-protoporphyrin IX monomethyl ester cyclase